MFTNLTTPTLSGDLTITTSSFRLNANSTLPCNSSSFEIPDERDKKVILIISSTAGTAVSTALFQHRTDMLMCPPEQSDGKASKTPVISAIQTSLTEGITLTIFTYPAMLVIRSLFLFLILFKDGLVQMNSNHFIHRVDAFCASGFDDVNGTMIRKEKSWLKSISKVVITRRNISRSWLSCGRQKTVMGIFPKRSALCLGSSCSPQAIIDPGAFSANSSADPWSKVLGQASG